MKNLLRAAMLLTALAIGSSDNNSVHAATSAALTRSAVPASTALVPAKPLTHDDVETWLDGYMDSALASAGIPGAVVVVVKAGSVVLEKGFGAAKVANGARIDPARTLFRVGSISKLFTWTAVMQQVEQGRIGLDTDVNRYLDFKIPPFAGRPITMRNLMTHTAGFEDAHRGIATLDPGNFPMLGAALRRDLPVRVYLPGTTPAYSNYGAALAGYIVERVSGEPFDEYIARHILRPLEMHHSTFQQPLPPALQRDMAAGYADDAAKAGGFELVVWSPAGGLSATGDDMSRFMIAHLQDGAYDGQRILLAATARAMHNTTLSLVPPLNGMELGFYQQNINGRRVIAHAGDTVLFHSLLALYPDERTGIFVSFNGAGRAGAVNNVRQQLFERFSDRYFPDLAGPEGRLDAATAAAHSKMFAPAYYSSRSSYSAFIAATKLLAPVSVMTNTDGTVSVSAFKTPSGRQKRFIETAPFVWKQVDGHDRLAAIVKNGRIVRFSTDDFAPILVFDEVPWQRSPVWLVPAFAFGLATFAITLLAWPLGMLMRRRYAAIYPLDGARAHADKLVRVTVATAAVAIVGWLWILTEIIRPMGIYLLSDHDGLIYAIEVLTIIGFTGAFASACYNVTAVWRARAGWPARAWSIALLFGSGAVLYTGWTYRLMTLSVRF